MFATMPRSCDDRRMCVSRCMPHRGPRRCLGRRYVDAFWSQCVWARWGKLRRILWFVLCPPRVSFGLETCLRRGVTCGILTVSFSTRGRVYFGLDGLRRGQVAESSRLLRLLDGWHGRMAGGFGRWRLTMGMGLGAHVHGLAASGIRCGAGAGV